MLPPSAAGSWRGTYDLWFEDPTQAERSEASADVAPSRLTYTWTFRGAPQRGTIDLREAAGEVVAEWTDTWHQQKPMIAAATVDGEQIAFTGTFAVPGGPDWGWRTELHASADRLELKMFNVTPAGEETRAVAMICTR